MRSLYAQRPPARIAQAILERNPVEADEAMKQHFGQNIEVLSGIAGSGGRDMHPWP